MHWFEPYDAVVFDCDGVILDSNFIKIEVMAKALSVMHEKTDENEKCLQFFSSNFGLSRYKHVEKFIADFLSLDSGSEQSFKEELLKLYTFGCDLVYSTASVTPGFLAVIDNIKVPCFVASGSEEKNLRATLSKKKLADKFKAIYGSPVSKVDNLNTIKAQYGPSNPVLIGDSIQDYKSARAVGIDFIAFTPFSADKTSLIDCCKENGLPMIDSWECLL